MLDILLLRKDLDTAIARLETRKKPQAFLDVAAFQALEAERKTLQTRTEELQAQRNQLSKQIGSSWARATMTAPKPPRPRWRRSKVELEQSATRLEQIQPELQALLLAVPNLPHESVPVGADEHGNVEVRRWGTPCHLRLRGERPCRCGYAAGPGFRHGRQALGFALYRDERPPRAPAPCACASSCSTCKPRSTATPSATCPTS